MICSRREEDVNYGGMLFCKICGMDIGLDMKRITSQRGYGGLYCCEKCAETRLKRKRFWGGKNGL